MKTEVEITTLKDLVLARGLNRRQLADKAGLAYRTVLYALGGDCMVSLRTALKLSDALDISLDDLVELMGLKEEESK